MEIEMEKDQEEDKEENPRISAEMTSKETGLLNFELRRD